MSQEQIYNQSILNPNVGDVLLANLFRIGSKCVAEIDGRFFLLVNIEIGPTDSKLEEVVIFKISPAVAAALLKAGIRRCQIANQIPVSMPGKTVKLICGFVEAGKIFLVFDIENCLVLVKVPLCNIVDKLIC